MPKTGKAIVTLEQRFIEKDGTLYTSGAFDRSFWKRYLDVFSEVLIVARVKSVEKLPEKAIAVSGDNIKYYPLPHYIGLKQALQNLAKTKRALKDLVEKHSGSFILRVGSPIADILAPILKRKQIPYAVEVVGDPWDVFAPGAIKHKLRPFLRWYFSKKLKAQCAKANFCSYVTENALQKRYPPLNSKLNSNYSSISLDESYFHNLENVEGLKPNWMFTGTLEVLQKAPDVLIKAFKQVVENYPEARLTIVGDGREKAFLKKLAKDLGIESNVEFLGHLPSPLAVREKLIESPYFVLPSRGEGLPRAMIEAMACSRLCVGSNIGGILELLDEKWCVPVNNVDALAETMIKIMALDPQQKRTIALTNSERAKSYLRPILDKRRSEFYEKVKAYSENIS